MDQRELRENNPSGWLMLTKSRDMVFVIDNFLDLPPEHPIDRENIEVRSGVSGERLDECLDILLELEVIEEEGDDFYVLNEESNITQELFPSE